MIPSTKSIERLLTTDYTFFFLNSRFSNHIDLNFWHERRNFNFGAINDEWASEHNFNNFVLDGVAQKMDSNLNMISNHRDNWN